MRGFGCLIALVTGVLGIFFWPIWLLTLGGLVMFAIGQKGKRQAGA